MSPGKQASEREAAAPMAAGARLESMRRRVRLSRLVVLSALAAGPVALCVAVASTPTTVQAATSSKPSAVRTAAVAADPGGYAQLFVSVWLRSSADDATSAQARLAQSMAPDIELPAPAPAAGAQSKPESVTAVRSAQREGGAWSVTVAAQYADGSVRYYAVPVAADPAGASFTVTGAPGVVADPARTEVPKSSYGVTVPEGDLSSAVGEFLAAYLTGAGEVDRYLAPGVRMSAVSPAPYTTVSVQQVSAVEEAAAGQVPADGTKVRVLVQVEARDSGGRWPLGYELTLKARSGRWEVAALESGTTQDGGAR
ncbi:conjugal transfer protein [Streptomyces sp. NBC_01728]|uniref:conjugal transfer protein n=1 Tax=unclassified Streptomyces TaxID=2593676 RepID=UPI002259D87F|nr:MULTISPECIES: conjugal transfer protein [unclassified Streptomyces]MCX4462507.1 conjugal transfer protein [Streptomyces sp. NBC_01719]MCX4490067.1 conjugal transfer protein [Streptomyces sp. NBC_01728]MCX4499474.1 conjugal transfer protein [Streptomyces sp. NBC_01728]